MKLAYEACDKLGATVSATIDAESPAEAIERLRREGLFVLQVTPAATGPQRAARRRRLPRLGDNRSKRLMAFTRQMQMLISTGTPLFQALESVERQIQDEAWAAVVRDVRQTVEDGAPLSEALQRHPAEFSPIYCSLIAAGESSGKLSPILARLATLTRKEAQIRGAIVGAMVYPTLLIGLGVAVLITMMVAVLPRFEDMFRSLDVPLPPSTQALMALSHGFLAWWWLALLLAIGGAFALRSWLRSDRGRLAIDDALIHGPVIGPIYRSFVTARIARLMGLLLNGSLPLLEVLALVRRASGNRRYAAVLGRAEELVTRGEPISTAFEGSPLIDANVTEALRAGEQSGQIATAMTTVAEFMDDENDVVIRSLTSVLEPVILIVLGVVVGFIAISMFLPLFDLATMGG